MLFKRKTHHADTSHMDIPVPGSVNRVQRDISRVRCGFWLNPDIAGLSLEGKTLALYLLTAHSPVCITPEDVAQVLHISHRKARRAFAELEEAGLGLLAFGVRNGNGSSSGWNNGSGSDKAKTAGRVETGGEHKASFLPAQF